MKAIVISGRRVVWGINGILLIAAVFLFRPVRTWVDQVFVARIIHPNLDVHELRFHRSASRPDQTIVQATHFNWGATDDARCFGITAENAWIVVEDKPLVAGSVSVPKAVLENSRLYMETLPSVDHLASHPSSQHRESSEESIWQNYLDAKHGSWNWSDLRKFLDSQLQTDAFTSACKTTIDEWVARGASLAETANALIPGETEWNNPLRDPDDLDQRIRQIDQLSQTQYGLPEELESVERSIEGKLILIGETFEQQRAALKLNPTVKHLEISQQRQPQGFDLDLKAVATGLLEQSAQRVFAKHGLFMELADRFCRAALRDTRPEYDREIYGSPRDHFNLDHLSAVGLFRCDPMLVPFRLNSNARRWHSEGSTMMSTATFDYQFDRAPISLLVRAQNCQSNSALNEVQMEISPLAANSPLHRQKPDLNKIASPQWSLRSDGKQISGSLQIDKALIPIIFENQQPMVESALGSWENDPSEHNPEIRLDFNGTWNTVRWTVSDAELPFWYMKEILLEQQRQLEQRNQEQVACVEQYFHHEIERLDTHLQLAIDQARIQSQRHAETILAARSKLSEELSKLQQVEFARQPGSDVQR